MKKLICLGSSLLVAFLIFGIGYSEEAKLGTISGQIMVNGDVPIKGWVAYFFNAETGPPPDLEKYRRIPDHMVLIGDDGRFTTELVEGVYFIAAVKRLSGGTVGPPKEGDYFISPRDDKGRPKSHIVKAGGSIDIGVISGVETFKGFSQEGISGIEGVILDMNGKPIKGAIVAAFQIKTETRRPLFVSDLTDSDGKYFFRVAEGTYYLKVRSGYGGGPPVAGEIIEGYGEKKPDAITVKKGEIIKGVNIKVVEFPGRGPKKE
jgi:hypothetical protein